MLYSFFFSFLGVSNLLLLKFAIAINNIVKNDNNNELKTNLFIVPPHFDRKYYRFYSQSDDFETMNRKRVIAEAFFPLRPIFYRKIYPANIVVCRIGSNLVDIAGVEPAQFGLMFPTMLRTSSARLKIWLQARFEACTVVYFSLFLRFFTGLATHLFPTGFLLGINPPTTKRFVSVYFPRVKNWTYIKARI